MKKIGLITTILIIIDLLYFLFNKQLISDTYNLLTTKKDIWKNINFDVFVFLCLITFVFLILFLLKWIYKKRNKNNSKDKNSSKFKSQN